MSKTIKLTSQSSQDSNISISGTFSQWQKVGMDYNPSEKQWEFDVVSYLIKATPLNLMSNNGDRNEQDKVVLSKDSKILFKYIKEDDEWFYDQDIPYEDDGFGSFNNYVIVDHDVFYSDGNEEETSKPNHDVPITSTDSKTLNGSSSSCAPPMATKGAASESTVSESQRSPSPDKSTLHQSISEGYKYGSVVETSDEVGEAADNHSNSVTIENEIVNENGSTSNNNVHGAQESTENDQNDIYIKISNLWRWFYGIVFVSWFRRFGLFGYGSNDS